ncbi:MAG: ATP synthase F1 subunit gamma [Prevotellaceae bacterium]|jgi:F-type H+-transporting ATPase subunit gamma|nr:ATP synthase F1 subunit gamma [Prevotellaceae bacterium]
MASLKEIRGRINSVTNTRKITGAMKMVSSAKLHRAQDAIMRFYPYWKKISGIMDVYLENNGGEDLSILTKQRKVGRLAIVAFSSNSSLCGVFNANVQKKLSEVLAGYSAVSPKNISLYLIGKKIYEEFTKKKSDYAIKGAFAELADKPNYEGMNVITNELLKRFFENDVDRMEIIYNKFKNTAIQSITHEPLLPITLAETTGKKENTNYIIEPNPQQLLEALIPSVIRLQMYRVMLNSYASEHGARTTAMQIATDNADELINNLVIQYNKLRQDAITKEIIDIVGGTEVFR